MSATPSRTTAHPATTRERVGVLFRTGGFRRFFAARALSQVGDGIFQFAAFDILLLQDPGPSPVVKLFVLTALMLIPFSIVAPFSGVFIDRWERRKIITRVPLLRALIAALLPAAAAAWGTDSVAFFAIVLVVLSANRFFLATMSTVLPQLIEEDDLLLGNSVSSTGGSVATVVGLGIGSALAVAVGGTSTALFAALAFAASAAVAHRLQVHRGLPPHKAPLLAEVAEVLRQLGEGVRAVRRDARVRYAMTAISTVQLLVGATTATMYFAFIVVLGLGAGAATGVLSVLAVGIGVGVVLVPVLGRRIRHDVLIPIAYAIAAVGVLVAIAGGVNRTLLTFGTFFVGMSYAFAKIPVDTIVQEQMADQVRGRAFAAYDMLFNLARVTGVGVVALAYGRTCGPPCEGAPAESGTIGMIVGIGAAYLVATVLFAWWERGGVRRGWMIGPTDLLQPGEVVTVRAYAGYRADEEPRAIVIGGNELPIESIDWRAVVEEEGRRARVFVVRVGHVRVRLAHREADDTGWVIERVTPIGSGSVH